MMDNKKILVVDDDALSLKIIAEVLGSTEYDVTVCQDAVEAMYRLKKSCYSAVITDLNMPHENGLSFAKKIKEHAPDMTVVMVTASALNDIEEKQNLINDYVDEILHKPFSKESLLSSLKRA